jgi:hypothetical protein
MIVYPTAFGGERRCSGWDQRLTAHVFAGTKQECRLRSIGVALDVTDKDDLIAAVVPILVAALEMRSGADRHGSAAFGDYVVDIGKS